MTEFFNLQVVKRIAYWVYSAVVPRESGDPYAAACPTKGSG
jgi:hypothetical protein